MFQFIRNLFRSRTAAPPWPRGQQQLTIFVVVAVDSNDRHKEVEHEVADAFFDKMRGVYGGARVSLSSVFLEGSEQICAAGYPLFGGHPADDIPCSHHPDV